MRKFPFLENYFNEANYDCFLLLRLNLPHDFLYDWSNHMRTLHILNEAIIIIIINRQ